jgi:hypothetical protein
VRDQAPGEADGLIADRDIVDPVLGPRLSGKTNERDVVIRSYTLWQKQVWSQILAATLEFAAL